MPSKSQRALMMANSSLGLGIASLVCSFATALSLALAPMGVIFALLSRDESCKLSKNAKLGIILSIISYAITIYMIVNTLILLINTAGGIDHLYDYIIEQMNNFTQVGL